MTTTNIQSIMRTLVYTSAAEFGGVLDTCKDNPTLKDGIVLKQLFSRVAACKHMQNLVDRNSCALYARPAVTYL